MKKPLLALLAVAAVAVVSVIVIMVNTPEWRMDRRYDKLLRSYEDDPEQLFQRAVDDRDLLFFFLVNAFLTYNGLERCGCGARTSSYSYSDHEENCDFPAYWKQHRELVNDFSAQLETEFCDCGSPAGVRIFGDGEVLFVHPEDCNLTRALQDMRKTWGSYVLRKKKEFHEAWLNR